MDSLLARGVTRVSSEDISRKVNVGSWVVRRDLSHFGAFGRPSIGYDAAYLRERIAGILHLDASKNVVWVGAYHLLGDLSLIDRFELHGFKVVAVLDPDPSRAPEPIRDMEVLPLDAAPSVAEQLEADVGVIAVPDEEAQLAADVLVSAGIPALLDLTPGVITVPPSVRLRHVDVISEMFALSYYCGEHDQQQELMQAITIPDDVPRIVETLISDIPLPESLQDAGSGVLD